MTTTDSAVRPGSWAAWKMAFRPGTLWIAAVPVIVTTGWVFALKTYGIHWPTVVLAIICSLIIQAITNMQNDVGYTKRGHHTTGERTGMPRATQIGVLTIHQLRLGIAACVTVALLLGIPLIVWHGWIILLLGVASIAAAILYMGGFRPIAFTAWGEFYVFIFFGLIAVNGTYFMLTHTLTLDAVILSVAIGLLAAAVLMVNNYRDAIHDEKQGRHTLAVVLGGGGAQKAFTAMIYLPFMFLFPFASYSLAFLLPLLALPLAISIRRSFITTVPGFAFNAILLKTVQLEALFGGLFCLAGIIAGMR